MAAGNDNNGLKIALAVSITLVILLGVASYFLYSSYAETSARLGETNTKLTQANTEKGQAVEQLNQVRDLAGLGEGQTIDEIRKKYTENNAALTAKVQAINTYIGNAVKAIRQEAAEKKLETIPKEVADLESKGAELAQALNGPENLKGVSGQLDKTTELLANTANLLSEISRDNINLRRDLAAVNGITAADIGTAEAARKAKADQVEQITNENTQTLATLRARLEELQAENQELATSKNELEGKSRTDQANAATKIRELQMEITSLHEKLSKSEDILDSPDGRVVTVDNARGEVRVNLTRDMGVRPRMRMSIFDKSAPGIPSDKVKATIEITQVGSDGSNAKVIDQKSLGEPIMPGDIVYSAAWSPNEPERFALVGKIDLNRDGVDDREDVKRMIEAAGGIVVYDLPPAKVGQESGKLSPRLAWYIVDELDPIRAVTSKPAPPSEGDLRFEKRKSDIISEARLYGVRPLPLERLAAYLGYDYRSVDKGRVQYKDEKLIDSILYPKGRKPAATPAPAEGDAPVADPSMEEKAPGNEN
jgi:hypothetical protein